MPVYSICLHTPLQRSFRVEQVAGLFDVPLDEKLRHALSVELPGLDEDWTIGAIVGPSGSGKTTLARAVYGDALYEPKEWPADAAIIDGLGNAPLKQIARVLTAVGLGSVPTWLRPYRVLSTGERFRADLALAVLAAGERDASASRSRCLADRPDSPESPDREAHASRSPAAQPLLVIDEFTSTLDRIVAKTTSASLSRLLRNPQSQIPNPKLVVLTCHDDILPWLEPDWTLDLSNGMLKRGRLRRPPLRLAVQRVPQKLWSEFARHHYLAGGLAASATCYAAFWEDELSEASGRREPPGNSEGPFAPHYQGDMTGKLTHPARPSSTPVAFCAVVAALGWKQSKRITRLVTLPEFQGLGIASRLAETVAAHEAGKGNRVTITASHPAIVAHCSRSPRWRYLGVKKTGSTRQTLSKRAIRCSTGRAVASFEFVPPGEREA